MNCYIINKFKYTIVLMITKQFLDNNKKHVVKLSSLNQVIK